MKRFTLFFTLAAASLMIFSVTACKSSHETTAQRSLTGLEITTPAARNYTVGNRFNTTNLVVTAIYSNKAEEDVTLKCTFEPSLRTALTTADTAIMISYTEDNFTFRVDHGITVRNPEAPSSVVNRVRVSPVAVQVQKGKTFQFSRVVEGDNNPSREVVWSVIGGSTGTGISDDGLLTVAPGETALTLTVKAASFVDAARYDTATVTVTSVPVEVTVTGVILTPPVANVEKGGTQNFSATVTGTNAPQSVTWSVEGSNSASSINNGLLTVAAGETASTLTVKATSTTDAAKYGTATVSVTAALVDVTVTGVTLTPPTTSVEKGGTQNFNATVTGTNAPQSVIWSVEGTNGASSINNGLLTVTTGEIAQTLTVRAASTVTGFTHISGTAVVTVTTSSVEVTVTGVTLTPPTANVEKGGTRNFNATVTGTNAPQSVTWSVEGSNSASSINNGLLTVAAGETASTLTVKATSTADTAKYGTATVTVTNPPPVTVTFNPNATGGVSGMPNPSTVTVNLNEPVSRPPNPSRTGYTFDNWYETITGGSPYNFSLPVTKNMTLYARWTSTGGGGGGVTKIDKFDAAGIRLGAFIRSTWGIPPELRPADNPGWAGGYEGWNPGWMAKQIHGEYLTDLMLAFALIKSDQSTISFSDSVNSINPPEHYLWNEFEELHRMFPHLRINLSVGGWNGPHFAAMANDPNKRATFVNSCINLIREKNLDGLDIDWEYPMTGGQYPQFVLPNDADNWVGLLRDLRQALTTLGNATGKYYYLSACCPVGDAFISVNKPQEAAQWVDHLTLMAYDMWGSWEKSANHAAPLYKSPGMPDGWSTDEAITGYTNKGTRSDHIMVGFPAYGMGWTVTPNLSGDKPGLGLSGSVFLQENNRLYDDIKKLTGYTYYWDDTAKAPFLYKASTGEWITYCDTRQVEEIAKYVKQKNLGGLFYWEYAGDWDAELLKAAYEALVAEYGL